MPWPHNIYLELMAERGALGFLSFLAVVILTLRNRILTSVDIALMPLRNAAVSGLLILLVAGMLDLSFLRLWVFVAMAIQVALIWQNVDARRQ